MKRLTFRTENQWRSLRDGADADLIRLSLIADRFRVGFAVTLLGFGLGLTYWHKEPEPLSWGELAAIAPAFGDFIPKHRWEPIEHDGYAGEPQGMEKAP